MKIHSILSVLITAMLLSQIAIAGEDYVPTLITETPYEGRQLAIKLARKSIGEMQSNPEIKKKIRMQYANDGATLIEAAEVIALEFQTIAAANNYWRK